MNYEKIKENLVTEIFNRKLEIFELTGKHIETEKIGIMPDKTKEENFYLGSVCGSFVQCKMLENKLKGDGNDTEM